MFRIACRYQHWAVDGIQWTRWFDYKSGIKDEPVARVELEKLKAEAKKDNKLKQEYVLLKDDEPYPENK